MEYYHTGKYPIEILKTENMNKKFEMHNHARHYVISIVKKGSVNVCLNGVWKRFVVGEYFIVSPLEPHAVYLEENEKVITMCIGKSLIEECELFELDTILKELLENAVQDNILTIEESKCFSQALQKIYKNHAGKTKAIESPIEELTERIADFPEEVLPLNKMAEECYLSKYYLVRKFKKGTGLTPHQFHIQNRIRKAQHLLRKGYSVVKVSVKMGFYDQSHFNKYFQKIVGISPIEYIASKRSIEEIK